MIVIVLVAEPTFVPAAPVTVKVNVSFASRARSPFTVMVAVRVRTPLAKLAVPERAT